MISKQLYGLGYDIWSLGILFHLILTGQHAFKDPHRKTEGAKVCLLELDLENDELYMRLSVECKDLLRIMLEKDERDRASID